jgi:hypothetical protein
LSGAGLARALSYLGAGLAGISSLVGAELAETQSFLGAELAILRRIVIKHWRSPDRNTTPVHVSTLPRRLAPPSDIADDISAVITRKASASASASAASMITTSAATKVIITVMRLNPANEIPSAMATSSSSEIPTTSVSPGVTMNQKHHHAVISVLYCMNRVSYGSSHWIIKQ